MNDKEATWREATERRRAALEALGIEVPYCLSGEPDECGGGDVEHFASYTATLMAHAQWDMRRMEYACPGQGTGKFIAETFAEQCHALVPEGFDCEDLSLRAQFAVLIAATESDEE